MDKPEPVEVKAFTPEECGWVRVGPYTWEKPDGKIHAFPRNGHQLVEKLVSPIPKREEPR